MMLEMAVPRAIGKGDARCDESTVEKCGEAEANDSDV
jgi:hypothetical protein